MRKIFNSKKRELRFSSWELKRCKIGERVMLSYLVLVSGCFPSDQNTTWRFLSQRQRCMQLFKFLLFCAMAKDNKEFIDFLETQMLSEMPFLRIALTSRKILYIFKNIYLLFAKSAEVIYDFRVLFH